MGSSAPVAHELGDCHMERDPQIFQPFLMVLKAPPSLAVQVFGKPAKEHAGSHEALAPVTLAFCVPLPLCPDGARYPQLWIGGAWRRR